MINILCMSVLCVPKLVRRRALFLKQRRVGSVTPDTFIPPDTPYHSIKVCGSKQKVSHGNWVLREISPISGLLMMNASE